MVAVSKHENVPGIKKRKSLTNEKKRALYRPLPWSTHFGHVTIPTDDRME
jgi:hypothetical protein